MKEMIVWTGPVHSGKSTKALLRAQRYLRLGHDVVLVRPLISLRPEQGEEPGMLVTKTKHRFPAIELENVSDLREAAAGASVLWIDEPMLFPNADGRLLIDLVQEVRTSTVVLVSGLCATSELTMFGDVMPTLMALADRVVWCLSDCDFCGSLGVATRSVCTVEKQGDVLVGGEGVYKAACPSCWANERSANT
jgi:thymidine kinase